MFDLDRILANPEAYHRAYVELTTEIGAVYKGYIFPKGGPQEYRKVTFVTLVQHENEPPELVVLSVLPMDKIKILQTGV